MSVTIHAAATINVAHDVRVNRGARTVVQAPIVRDHRDDFRYPRTVVTPTYGDYQWTPAPSYTFTPALAPVTLLAPTSLASHALSIDTCNDNLSGMTALDLGATSPGKTFISRIELVDSYGNVRTIPVNQFLSDQNPSIRVAIGNGAGVERVILDGHSDWGATMQMRAV